MARRSRRMAVLTTVTALLVTGVGVGPTSAAGDSVRQPAQPLTPAPSIAQEASHRARASGQKVAVDAMTTETTQVWALPDGKFESVIAAGPVRSRKDGQWAEVDLTLRRRADGTITPGHHLSELVLAGARADGEQQLASIAAEGARRSMHWRGALPEPVLDGRTATYRDVMPGIDLVVEATMTGYEQFTVVKNRAALARVGAAQRALRLGDRSSTPDGQGGLLHRNADGQVIGITSTPLMWDAAVDTRTGTPKNLRRVSLPATGDGFGVAADEAWLNDPARKFPITIDPSDQQQNAWGGEDTWVRSDTGSTYWYSTELELGTQNSGGIKRIAYVNFTTAGMHGATIHYANVKLWGAYSAGVCTDQTWQLFLAQSKVNSSTNWSGRPYLVDGYGNNLGSQDGNGDAGGYAFTPGGWTTTPASGGCTGQWMSSDARGVFQVAATRNWNEFSVAMTPYWDNTNLYYKRFKSYNSGTWPHAIVSWSFAPTLASRSTDPATACVEGAGRPAIGVSQPTLKAAFAQAEGHNVNVQFEYGEVGGTTVTSPDVAAGAGATASYTVPAGAMTDGKHYRWRTFAKNPQGVASAVSGWCEFTVDVWAGPVAGCPGTATTKADFNGDNVTDIVIADPLKTVSGQWEAGAVTIVNGATSAATSLDQSLTEVPDTPEPGDRFGTSIAVLDLNKDGCADLAVGTPHEDLTKTDTGLVNVFYGAPAGLGKGPAAETLTPGTNRIPGTEADYDYFGQSLAAGQTTAAEPFLVIGAPGDEPSGNDSGSAVYIRGDHRILISQGDFGQTNETDDRGGFAVAASTHHFAVAYPGENINSGTQYGGQVCVFNHTVTAGLPGLVRCIRQGSGASGSMEGGDAFGKSISMAPYRAPGQPAGTDSILVVGVPGEDFTSTADTGEVQQFRISGSTTTELATVTQNTTGVSDSNEAGDLFGEKVFVVNTRPDLESSATTLLLAVGSPGENAGTTIDTGAVRVFPAGTATLTADVAVERKAGCLPGTALAREMAGIAIGGNLTDLLVAMPYLGQQAVYGLRWADLAAGSCGSANIRIWTPGSGAAAFGAQVG